jgi:hypothetical protein
VTLVSEPAIAVSSDQVCLGDLTRSTAIAVSPVSHVLDESPEQQDWSSRSKSLPLQSQQPTIGLGKTTRSTTIVVSPAGSPRPPGASHEVEESAIAVCHKQHDKQPSQQASKVDCHGSLASQQVAHDCLSSPTSSTAVAVSPASLRRRRSPKTTTSPSQDQHGEGYAFPPAVASASAQRPTATRPHAQARFCGAMKQQQLFSTGEPKTDCWKNSLTPQVDQVEIQR